MLRGGGGSGSRVHRRLPFGSLPGAFHGPLARRGEPARSGWRRGGSPTLGGFRRQRIGRARLAFVVLTSCRVANQAGQRSGGGCRGPQADHSRPIGSAPTNDTRQRTGRRPYMSAPTVTTTRRAGAPAHDSGRGAPGNADRTRDRECRRSASFRLSRRRIACSSPKLVQPTCR